MRHILSGILLFLVPLFSMAQNARSERQQTRKERISEMSRMQEEGVITFEKSFLIAPKLTTDGYGVFLEIGRAQSVRKSLLFQLDISERKHQKEVKQTNPYYAYGTGFDYGKENFFYPVRLGVQQQILLGNKSNKNGVAVTGNFGGGLVAAVMRPYYLQVSLDGLQISYVKYNSPDSVYLMDPVNILGGPSFNKGWNEIFVIPGAYAKAALRFDYGRFNEMITAIEVGITGEIYSKKIPQMIMVKDKQFFFGAYAALLFGKRK